jgi:hypothetical protein
VHKEYGGPRLEVIGLSLDETLEVVRLFLGKKPSPFLQVYIGERSQSMAARLYGVEMIPSIWLIAPDGRILARDLRGAAIHEAVAKALKDEGPANPKL